MKKTIVVLMTVLMGTFCITGCGNSVETTVQDSTVVDDTQTSEEEITDTEADTEEEAETNDDQKAADEVAALIDAIYVQERTDETDAQCTDAKAAWDALTDEQKELVEGENADPDYFGRDTGGCNQG